MAKVLRLSVLACAVLGVSGCQFEGLEALRTNPSAVAPSRSTTIVERDVEAPDVFQVTENGLWDGRPSLGGVWVAHSDALDPERVIIRNEANGKFVIGALFKREATAPGPGVQVSSDAAEALGMLAGAPTQLNVTALRKEEVADESAPLVDTIAEAPAIETASLDDPIASAAATLDSLDAPTATPTPAPAAPKPAATNSSLSKPYVQIGIFSVQANATRTVQMLGSQGITAEVRNGSSNGKSFWRVVAGPAKNAVERFSLLDNVKAAGFTDAYPVTN